MNKILMEDIKEIANSNYIDWNKFKDKKVLITGATGLICSLIVRTFLYRNKEFGQNTKLFLVVRNKNKAKEMFEEDCNIVFLEHDIEKFIDIKINGQIDFIIHGASPTKSKFFVENPVETLNTAIIGTKNVLEFAKEKKIESMVYLSSMEMYGTINENEKTTENELGYINPLDVRSSYSEGKRMCELYSFCYYKEYNVPVKIARIAQTFGAGISKEENRVYKYFIDCILKQEDIVLKSSGQTLINYSYTVDTVLGILCILLKGVDGEAYNIVSNKTNMTILDSAKWLVEKFGENKIQIVIEPNLQKKSGLAPENRMVLSNDKLKKIGWNCKYTLKEGYRRLMMYVKEGI